MGNWLMENWLDLMRFWAALIGTGCFGLVGVLVADRFSGHGRPEDGDGRALLAGPAHRGSR